MAKKNPKPPRVLIADDERALARALSLKLENTGAVVEMVHDGMAAQEKIHSQSYDLIMLDLMMPQYDGFAVLADLKKRGTDTPVFILSNLGQNSDIERAKQAGATEYFIKSGSSLKDIISKATKVLNAK